MIGLTRAVRVFAYAAPADMRRSYNGLESLVRHKELLQVMDCITNEPIGNWECGENQVASIKEKFCVAAQQRFVSCLAAATQ